MITFNFADYSIHIWVFFYPFVFCEILLFSLDAINVKFEFNNQYLLGTYSFGSCQSQAN
jgi:hypothetical protein